MKTITGLIITLAALSFETAPAQSVQPQFQVTHSIRVNLQLGAGGLTRDGVQFTPIIYHKFLYAEGTPLHPKAVTDQETDAAPSLEALQQWAKTLTPGPLPTVIDIEKWNVYTKDKNARAASIEKLTFVATELRKARPDLKFGFYGMLPERTYWPIVDPKKANELREWESFNRQAAKDIAPLCDAAFPSLYTFYKDEKGWVKYATAMLQEARKFKKPVYAFLCPQYEVANPKPEGDYIEPKYWRLQLETCRKHADGIVIWDYGTSATWDENAPWWKETVSFLDKLKKK